MMTQEQKIIVRKVYKNEEYDTRTRTGKNYSYASAVRHFSKGKDLTYITVEKIENNIRWAIVFALNFTRIQEIAFLEYREEMAAREAARLENIRYEAEKKSACEALSLSLEFEAARKKVGVICDPFIDKFYMKKNYFEKMSFVCSDVKAIWTGTEAEIYYTLRVTKNEAIILQSKQHLQANNKAKNTIDDRHDLTEIKIEKNSLIGMKYSFKTIK
jgi:hypothetical protein